MESFHKWTFYHLRFDSMKIFVFYCYGNSPSLVTRIMYFWFLVLKSHVYKLAQLYDGGFQSNCLQQCAMLLRYPLQTEG